MDDEKDIAVCVLMMSGQELNFSLRESDAIGRLEAMVLDHLKPDEPDNKTVKFLQGTHELAHSLPASDLEDSTIAGYITEMEGAEKREEQMKHARALALRILGQAEAATHGPDGAPAKELLVNARLSLQVASSFNPPDGDDLALPTLEGVAAAPSGDDLALPTLEGIAAALLAVDRALMESPPAALPQIRTAKRAIYDFAVWRLHMAAPRNRETFMAAAKKAFGSEMKEEENQVLMSQLLLAYAKGPALRPAVDSRAADRRGGPRPRRHRATATQENVASP